MSAIRRKEKQLPTAVLNPPLTHTELQNRSNQLSANSSREKSSVVTGKLSLYAIAVIGAMGFFTYNLEFITNLNRTSNTTPISTPNSSEDLRDSVLIREQLEAKKKQLELAIKKKNLNIPKPIKPLSPPNYNQEIAAVRKAKMELDLIESTPKPNFQFALPELRSLHEPSLVETQILLDREIVRASSNYHKAIAKLNAAKSAYQQQQNLHSLALSRYETLQEQHQYELDSLKQQLQNIKKELR